MELALCYHVGNTASFSLHPLPAEWFWTGANKGKEWEPGLPLLLWCRPFRA